MRRWRFKVELTPDAPEIEYFITQRLTPEDRTELARLYHRVHEIASQWEKETNKQVNHFHFY